MTGPCSWAACDNPATAVVDTWPMCTPHLAEHHALADEENAPAAQEELDDAVRRLNGRGWTDRQMANATGATWTQVRARRRAMGLTATSTQPQAECGTRSAYKRHLRNSETPCDPCKAAAAAVRRATYARRRAA